MIRSEKIETEAILGILTYPETPIDRDANRVIGLVVGSHANSNTPGARAEAQARLTHQFPELAGYAKAVRNTFREYWPDQRLHNLSSAIAHAELNFGYFQNVTLAEPRPVVPLLHKLHVLIRPAASVVALPFPKRPTESVSAPGVR